jgi:hypothetical protein
VSVKRGCAAVLLLKKARDYQFCKKLIHAFPLPPEFAVNRHTASF